MGVIAGDDAYGRGGANIFVDEVGDTLTNLVTTNQLLFFSV